MFLAGIIKKQSLFQLEIHHYSVKSKTEFCRDHWTAVSFRFKLFSSAHQRSLVGTGPTTSKLESQSLAHVSPLLFLDLNFQLYWLMMKNWQLKIENSNKIPYYLQTINLLKICSNDWLVAIWANCKFGCFCEYHWNIIQS